MQDFNVYQYDEFALRNFRYFSNAKLQEIAKSIRSPILEIGPSVFTGAANSAIFNSEPELFFDVKGNLPVGSYYQTMDIDPLVQPNFLASIESDHPDIPEEFFESIICFSVLEHCKNPFKAVEEIHRVLKKSGDVYFLTPWDLRFHGPRPDCWRISDDGYLSLLEGKFEILEIEKSSNPFRPLSPFGIFCHAKKL